MLRKRSLHLRGGMLWKYALTQFKLNAKIVEFLEEVGYSGSKYPIVVK